jgi:hypothetical protein
MPEVHAQIARPEKGLFFDYEAIDATKIDKLPEVAQERIARMQRETKQQALRKVAILPVIMCGCYLVLIAYFKSRGGYKAEVLAGHAAEDEKFTGGVPRAVEG